MVRYTKNHRDANEPDIVKGLRGIGAVVELLQGKDIPDLLVGWRGSNYLIEVKNMEGLMGNLRGRANRGASILRPGQEEWHRRWLKSGQCAVATTLNDALRIIGATAKEVTG